MSEEGGACPRAAAEPWLPGLAVRTHWGAFVSLDLPTHPSDAAPLRARPWTRGALCLSSLRLSPNSRMPPDPASFTACASCRVPPPTPCGVGARAPGSHGLAPGGAAPWPLEVTPQTELCPRREHTEDGGRAGRCRGSGAQGRSARPHLRRGWGAGPGLVAAGAGPWLCPRSLPRVNAGAPQAAARLHFT